MENISRKRNAIIKAIARCKLTRDMMGGTPAMQQGGWITKGAAEEHADFESRRDNAVLFNGYARTLGFLVGQVFKKRITISEESAFRELFQRMEWDVDLKGNDLRTFAQSFFEYAINDGCRFLMVEYPRVEMADGQFYDTDSGEWRLRSRQADIEKGWRPYFVQFGYDDMIGWRYEYIGGKRKLTQLRVLERVQKYGKYDTEDETVEQIRLYQPGSWSLWRQVDDSKGDWVIVDEGQTSLTEIPLCVLMLGPMVSEMTADPALEDLAYLNLRHFLATADQHVMMQYVRRPPWFGRALVQDGTSLVFGPGRLIHSGDAAADLRSVGMDAGSVEAGRGELKDLEERMSMYGLQMLTPTLRASGGKTATQAQQESSEAVSQLTDWALALKDCLDQALRFAGMYENMEDGAEPEIVINTEFQPGIGLDPSMLMQAVEKAVISRQIALEEFQRRGLVADTYDWQDVLGMLQSEQVAPQEMPGLDMLRLAAESDQNLTGIDAVTPPPSAV